LFAFGFASTRHPCHAVGESAFEENRQDFEVSKISGARLQDQQRNMSKSKKPRTLAEQIADLDEPAPKGTI
jgi:hypothetical protein